MKPSLIYPIYMLALGALVYLTVPKHQIKKLAFWAVLFGASVNILAIMVFGKVFNVGGHINFMPFGFLGIPFFPPIAWTAYYLLFFYVIPRQKPWKWVFVLIASFYATFFSNVLVQLGILKWNYGRIVVPFLIYSSWHAAVTWAFFRFTEGATDFKQSTSFKQSKTHYYKAAKPALLKRFRK